MVVMAMNVLSLKYFCLGWSYSLEESTHLVCGKQTQPHLHPTLNHRPQTVKSWYHQEPAAL